MNNHLCKKFFIVSLIALCFSISIDTNTVLADVIYDDAVTVSTPSTKVESNRVIKIPEKQIDRERLSRGAEGARNRIIQYAYKFLGKPYIWGADGPKAFDCSGFTAYVYKQFGYALPHYTGYQVTMGKNVEKKNLKVGDLIFFNTTGANSHVGIYIGNNKFIHASSGKGEITVSELSRQYYRQRYSTARRFVE